MKNQPIGRNRLSLSLKALSSLSIGALINTASADLVGHWTFDEGTGTVAADSSTAANDGTINGNATWDADGVRGSFLTFDGSNDWVSTAVTLPLMDLTNDFTWACWAKRPVNDKPNGIIMGNRRNGNADFGPRQFIKATPSAFIIHNNGAATESIDYDDLGASWRHIAIVKTGPTLEYYQDGVLTTTQTLDAADVMLDQMPFVIGGQGGNPNGEFFVGSIDDVRIYDNALTAAEVLDLVGTVILPPIWDGNPVVVGDLNPDVAITGSAADFATDPLEGTLTFVKTGGPAWLSIASDGTFSGTPTTADIGANSFVVDATNADTSATATLVVRVVDPSAPEISAPLYGWWPLNDGSGATAIDISGNGSDAIITNASTGGTGIDGSVWIDDPDCGTVLGLSGDNATGAYAFATTLPAFTLDPSSEFTWSFWANAATTETSDIIVGNRLSPSNVNFTPREFIKFSGGGFQWDTNNVQTLAYSTIPANVWLHHSVVKAGDTLTYYRDGIELSTRTIVSAPVNPQPFFLGGQEFGERWAGMLSDVRLYEQALTPAEVFTVSNRKGLFAPIPVTAPVLTINATGGDLALSWNSKGGRLYTLRSSTDLIGPTSEWPVVGSNVDITSTPPENTLSLPRPIDATRFYVIEETVAPPITALEDNFENGQGGWTTGSDGAAGTLWELGTPSGTFTPTGANSGANCFGTNIARDYAINADIWLRSPAIDLTTAAGATLNLASFIDAEPTFDFGFINVLDAADNSLLAQVGAPFDATTADWTTISRALPAEALGKSVKIEFRFNSDELNVNPGWYVDDVVVTVP